MASTGVNYENYPKLFAINYVSSLRRSAGWWDRHGVELPLNLTLLILRLKSFDLISLSCAPRRETHSRLIAPNAMHESDSLTCLPFYANDDVLVCRSVLDRLEWLEIKLQKSKHFQTFPSSAKQNLWTLSEAPLKFSKLLKIEIFLKTEFSQTCQSNVF